ncbi:MAG: HDIG domain-containing protein [Deltaproteobacteria bacterium]|nr:HDIG domain-containing protein [Deltaproteobacteria bacterium]
MAAKTDKFSLRAFFAAEDRLLLWMLLFTATLITLLAHPNMVSTFPEYSPGDVAETNVKSTRDFLVENTEATQSARRKAAAAVLTVYDHDESMAGRTITRVQEAFSSARKALEKPGRDTAALKKKFQETLGIQVSEGAFRILERERFDSAIADSICHIVGEILDNGVVANKDLLLEEAEKGIVLRGIQSGKERYLTNLRRFYGPDQSKTMVRVIGDPILENMNYSVINLIVDFSQRLIQPNITPNSRETNARLQQAVEAVKPVYYKVKAGEMLLREGERVTDLHLAKLAALKKSASKDRTVFKSLGTGMLVLFFLLSWHFVYFRWKKNPYASRLKDMGLLCLTLLVFFAMAKFSTALSASLANGSAFEHAPSAVFYGTPLAAGAMTLCLFLGLEVALAFAVILTFSATMLFDNPFYAWTYFLVGSVLGAYWVRDSRERNVMIKAGVKVGAVNAGMVLAIYLQRGAPLSESFAWDAFGGLLGGLLAGVFTTGLVPMVEALFGYTTDIKLMELANLDRPVLRRLMIEAPGTYHHSVVVGSMVEAAAAQIGANPLLAKACGYYHDIGKIQKPLYFVENQMSGKNRHDKLAPSMSALILIAHLREGVEMAKKYRLGQLITDAIQQHHGTSLIRGFYEKAKQVRGEENVKEEDFRYPGPKPQTKEAGLVMLADVVEAASRTLENPTPARIQGNVQRLIRNIFADGQLDECELTLKDLHQIAKSFNKILAGIHHHRVEYPDANGKTNGKTGATAETRERKAGGNTDQQSAEPVQDTEKEDPKDGDNPLKRLGIS